MTTPLQPRLPSKSGQGRLTLIAAVAQNGVIGRGDDLPWSISEELRTFRALTLDHPLIMGRKSAEILYKKTKGRGLDRRQIFVMSRKGWPFTKTGDELYQPAPFIDLGPNRDARSCVETIKNTQRGTFFVAGGAEIYKAFLPYVDDMVISFVRKPYKGDVYFPSFNAEDWDQGVVITHHAEFTTCYFMRKQHAKT
jgi:dihydrofolate reductase